jgi:hypothetical protein
VIGARLLLSFPVRFRAGDCIGDKATAPIEPDLRRGPPLVSPDSERDCDRLRGDRFTDGALRLHGYCFGSARCRARPHNRRRASWCSLGPMSALIRLERLAQELGGTGLPRNAGNLTQVMATATIGHQRETAVCARAASRRAVT